MNNLNHYEETSSFQKWCVYSEYRRFEMPYKTRLILLQC